MEVLMTYEIAQDKEVPSSWRVEAIDYDNEGIGYIAIFAGPSAYERAKEYANWKTERQTSQRNAA
jgi:hypothetical protein